MKKVALLLCIALVLSLGACAPSVQRHTVADTFDTVIEIIYYGSDDAQKYFDAAQSTLKHWHKISDAYTDWADTDGIYKLNAHAGEWVEMHPDTMQLLVFAKEAYDKTDGSVNAMAGALSTLWKNVEQPPSAEVLQQAMKHTDMSALELGEGRARISDPDARIDVGAFAKGYALQKTAEVLKPLGFEGILSAVSSVVCIGDKDGTGYAVGISDQAGGVAKTVRLTGKSLSTSGTDQRFFEFQGKKYHHIIDLSTGFPAESGVTQASVVHQDAAWADVYSTAALIDGQTTQNALLRRPDGQWQYTGQIKEWIEDVSQ